MKTIRILIISLSVIFILGVSLTSCEKEEYNRVFKYYFEAELDSAYTRIKKAVEGTEEGLYKIGSKDIYKKSADSWREIGGAKGAVQQIVDEAYMGLIEAYNTFENSKNPMISEFVDLINECKFMLENTEEGNQPGQFKLGAKLALKSVLEKIEPNLEKTDLTQTEVDKLSEMLILALNEYDTQLIGDYNINIVNAGFESPGNNQTNFNRIDGWNCAGMINSWTNTKPGTIKASANNLENAPEGNCVMNIGEYSHPVWQRLNERLHSACTYILTYKARINYSNPTPSGENYETFVRTRIIVFNKFDETNPNFSPSNIQVVHEMSVSLGTEQYMDNFIECEHYFRGSVAPDLDGKRIAIQFISHEGAYKTDGSGNKGVTSSDTWVFIDDIKMIRSTTK